MESSFTVQNGEFFHFTKWRVLSLYKMESSFTVQNGEFFHCTKWRVLSLYKMERRLKRKRERIIERGGGRELRKG